MPEDIEEKIPLTKAFGYVALSVFVIWGTLFFAWGYHRYTQSKRQANPNFIVRALVASTASRDQLSCDQLAELLALSKDDPTNLYSIDPKEAKSELLAYPAIEQASVFRYHPNALVVDYELRKPHFRLVDFEHIALDAKGYPFPLQPIYSSKKIPELRLGLESLEWNQPITSKEFETACYIRNFPVPREVEIVKIDTHNMHALKRGSREIIVVAKEQGGYSYLRLATHRLEAGLKAFLSLRKKLEMPQAEQYQVLDLRSEGFALKAAGPLL